MLTRSTPLYRRPVLGLLTLFCAAALLAACGGGGGPTEAKTSFTSGPITGFGSIIVNGVRFDDSAAAVLDDDDQSRGRDALKLGMVVEVEGDAIASDASGSHGRAHMIHFGSEIVGPVGSVDLAARTLVVLGQSVRVTATTVFDDDLPNGLASAAVGSVLEVHALLDVASGQFTATRIEPKPGALAFKLRGIVANLDTTAKTFTLGGQLVSYAGIAPADLPTLSNGLIVRVRLQTAQVAGAWVATKLRAGARRVADHDEAEVEGLITAFTSSTQFSVNGIPVDASGASFPDGTAGLVLGARVEVHGRASNGVIVATKVELETEHEVELAGFELHGLISALDTTAQTFVLRGVTVSYAGAGVRFDNGSAATLAVGRNVEVRGVLSASGTLLQATRIKFES